MNKYCSRLLLFVLATAPVSLAQSGDVSLGELARKARTNQKAAVVFNDDNMRRSAVTDQDTGSVSTPGASADAKGSAPDASSPDAKDKKKDETKNAKSASADDKVSKLQQQLKSLKEEQSVWSKSAKNYEDKLADDTDDFRRQMDQEALENDKSNVQVYQRKIDQTQADLAKAREQGTAKSDNGTQGPKQ